MRARDFFLVVFMHGLDWYPIGNLTSFFSSMYLALPLVCDDAVGLAERRWGNLSFYLFVFFSVSVYI